jgi:hypothetical protein
MSDVADFLKLIETDINNKLSVYIPTSGQVAVFKPITVQQQKAIIKDTLSGVNGNINIQRTLNDIITYNNQSDVNICIADRCAILVQLRTAYLGTTVTDTSGKKGTLKPVLHERVVLPATTVVESDGIKATLSIPSLAKDSLYITELTNGKEYTNPGDLVNEMYIAEIAKFIETVEFKGISATPGIRDSITIASQLPTTLITKIMNFIKVVKDADNQFLITTEKGQVQLGSQFFNDPV